MLHSLLFPVVVALTVILVGVLVNIGPILNTLRDWRRNRR